ncbi:MAG: hypothetical protein GY869_03820, partial [Planctomycetes bacterium]|nr:hypothetical protein [Planctomycetota bacterium]
MIYSLAGYGLLTGLAVIGSANLAEAIFELCKTGLWVSGIFTFILYISINQSTITNFSRLITIGAGAQAVIALGQYSGLMFTGIPGAGDLAGTMVNKNQLAAALSLMFPFTVYTAYRGGPLWRFVAAAAAMLSMAVIILSNTRAVWVAMFCATFATLVVFYFRTRGTPTLHGLFTRHRNKLVCIAGSLIIVLGLFSSPLLRRSGQQSVQDRVMSI